MKPGNPVPVGFTFTAGRLDLAVREGGAAADEWFECDYAGAAYRVALGADLLVSGLSSAGAARVRMHLRDGSQGWDERPHVIAPLDEAGGVVPGAEYLAVPVRVLDGQGLAALAVSADVQAGAAARSAPVTFEEKVVVMSVGADDGVKPVAWNRFAETNVETQAPEDAEVGAAELEALEKDAAAKIKAQEWVGALVTVSLLEDAYGEGTVFTDGAGSQFTWGQVREWLDAKIADEAVAGNAPAAEEPAAEEPAVEAVQQPVVAPVVKARAKAGGKPAGKAAKATPPVKPTPTPKPQPQPEPVVETTEPAGAVDVADVVTRLVAALVQAGQPATVVEATVAATMAALGDHTALASPAVVTKPVAAPRAASKPATAKPAAKPARKVSAPVAVEPVSDGDGRRYELPRGVRVKATAKALRSALAAAEREAGGGIGFHVYVERADDEQLANYLRVEADIDGGVDAVADLADEVAADVIAAAAGELAAV